MARILALTTHATDDPTMATAPFMTAIGAIEAGQEVGILLVGEGAYLTKKAIVDTIHGVGFPPLSELLPQVMAGNVPVYV